MFTKDNKSVSIRLVLVLAFVAGILRAAPVRAREENPLVLPDATWYVAPSGNDSNDCATPSTPCATINGTIAKAVTSGDTIKAAIGTYTGSGDQVVLINKSVTLSGGWDSTFNAQEGISIIDGQTARRGIHVNLDVTATIERFSIQSGYMSWIPEGRGGGGIYNLGNLTLNDSEVTNNSAIDVGGGISNLGILMINNGTISNNTTQGYNHVGGGIANGRYNLSGGILTLNSTTVSGNSATIGGGIYGGGTILLNNSTISGNSAPGGGGGISMTGGTLTINNSTITNNSVPYGNSGRGGGIDHYGGNITVQNSIIAQNSANLVWGGPDCYSNTYEPSIIIESNGYNVIGNSSSCRISSTTGDKIGTGTNPILPGLTSLQDNGGLTLTHALVEDSPALDAGNPATPGSGGTACLEADQRGVSRPQGAHCDIGAYEALISFTDVSPEYWAWQYVERLVNAGITAGCGGGQYCPEATVTRAQMAIFLERGMHGSSYAPPSVGSSTGFLDVQLTHWAAAWIKQLAADGITGGCGGGNYCPDGPVTRAQMAVFLLKAKHGSAYTPPTLGGSTGFTDVDPTHWAGAWIKQLVVEGITAGCGNGNYCPESPVTRAQMAVFLVRTFNLP